MIGSSKKSFGVSLCSERNTFSRAAGARAREAGFFFHGSIFFAETVPTRYRTPPGGFAKWVLFRRHPGRQTDRENRHYENIYIDVQKFLSENDLDNLYNSRSSSFSDNGIVLMS